MDKDKLRKWCRSNWDSLPEMFRNDCLNQLDGFLFGNETTKEENLSYIKNYDDDPYFHFSSGMAIRNSLRSCHTDDELPEITKDMDGKPYGPARNWDDYYTGAIDELLEKYK